MTATEQTYSPAVQQMIEAREISDAIARLDAQINDMRKALGATTYDLRSRKPSNQATQMFLGQAVSRLDDAKSAMQNLAMSLSLGAIDLKSMMEDNLTEAEEAEYAEWRKARQAAQRAQ